MATPHVSAVAAVIWSSDTTLTNVEIREALQATALDLGAQGRDPAYGYGLVQAYDALQVLTGGQTYPIDLSVSAYKDKGAQYADLTWNRATSDDVDIYRDGQLIMTTENDKLETDITGEKGGGSAVYQVCEAGTAVCSMEVTANW